MESDVKRSPFPPLIPSVSPAEAELLQFSRQSPRAGSDGGVGGRHVMVPLAVLAGVPERSPPPCSVSAAFQTSFPLRHGALACNGGCWQEEGGCGRDCASAVGPSGVAAAAAISLLPACG